jgi:hypothetical protein
MLGSAVYAQAVENQFQKIPFFPAQKLAVMNVAERAGWNWVRPW